MVRRRSTLRFRKGAPRSWKVFASASGDHVAWKVPPNALPLSRGAYPGGDLGGTLTLSATGERFPSWGFGSSPVFAEPTWVASIDGITLGDYGRSGKRA